MQIKPRFIKCDALEQYPILKDDLGNEACLTLFEATFPDDGDTLIISSYKFWSVCGKNIEQYSNGAIARSSYFYWNTSIKNELYKGSINGIYIEEFECGQHCMFSYKEPGIKTGFKIKKVTNK